MSVFEVMQQLKLGDHAALFYRNRKEQFAAMMPYVQIGLSRNERCFYVVGDNSIRMVTETMNEYGIDVDRHTLSGALTITTVQEAFLKNGKFDPEQMVCDLADAVADSLKQGYTGFRGTGEMLWIQAHPGAAQQLQRYEKILDERFPKKMVAICQYNEPCFSPDVTADLLRTHSKVVARGRVIENFYHPARNRTAAAPAMEANLDGLLKNEGF